MGCCFVAVPAIVVVVIVYKIVDRLIRIPRIGNHSNRYILVTGCDTGFGNLLAKRLDQLGCHVFAGCLTEKGETELRKVSSDRLHTISLDVTKHENICKALDYVTEKLPRGRGLWGVVNNAGTIIKTGPADWFTVEDFKKQCDVNLWGPIDITETFLPLVKRERGRVVNMSSAAGRSTLPMSTTYSVSKYGVEAFTDGLRRSLHVFGCKAILIEPGAFQTPGSSRESFVGSVVRAWDDATPETKEEYGQAFLDYMKFTLTKAIDLHVSDRVHLVIDAYEHALLGRFPRARYAVGHDINFFYIPMQALPEWMGDALWRLLQRQNPLPAAAVQAP